MFSHDTLGGYWTSKDEVLNSNPNDPTALKFSILGDLEKFRHPTEQNFKFKLCYPQLQGIGGKRCNEWYQSSNPTTDTTIKGFKAVSLAFDTVGQWEFGKAWRGLGINEEKHRGINLIDDTPWGHNQYSSIGTFKATHSNAFRTIIGPHGESVENNEYLNQNPGVKHKDQVTKVELYVYNNPIGGDGFSGDIVYNYEGRDQSLYGMCGKLLLSSILDTQTFTEVGNAGKKFKKGFTQHIFT